MIGIYFEMYEKGGVDTVILNCLKAKGFENLLVKVLHNKQNTFISNAINEIRKKNIIDYPFEIYSSQSITKRIPVNQIIQKILEVLFKDISFFLTVPYFIYILKKEKITNLIVHNGGYPGAYSSFACGLAFYLLKKKKPIHVIHSKALKNRLHTILFDWLYDAIARKCFLNISVSNKTAKELFEARSIKSKIINNGVEIQKTNNPNFNFHKHINLLCVGRLDPNKGHFDLLKALNILSRKYPNTVHLKIYGESNNPYYEKELKKKCLELGVSKIVSFEGFSKDKKEIFKADQIVVVPSVKIEANNMVILEALSYGLPVIATNVGGVKDVFKHYDSRLLAQPLNHLSITKSIEYFLRLNDIEKDNIIKLGLQIVESHFSCELMSEKYINLLKYSDYTNNKKFNLF